MVVLSFTGTYCRAFIWPFIQCPGIYYPISVLCETSQRDDRQTVAPFVNSGGKRRRKGQRSSESSWRDVRRHVGIWFPPVTDCHSACSFPTAGDLFLHFILLSTGHSKQVLIQFVFFIFFAFLFFLMKSLQQHIWKTQRVFGLIGKISSVSWGQDVPSLDF